MAERDRGFLERGISVSLKALGIVVIAGLTLVAAGWAFDKGAILADKVVAA